MAFGRRLFSTQPPYAAPYILKPSVVWALEIFGEGRSDVASFFFFFESYQYQLRDFVLHS
jgi:hypothetical protein